MGDFPKPPEEGEKKRRKKGRAGWVVGAGTKRTDRDGKGRERAAA